jgi:hypothetical protein
MVKLAAQVSGQKGYLPVPTDETVEWVQRYFFNDLKSPLDLPGVQEQIRRANGY